jgi:hypothetical protein
VRVNVGSNDSEVKRPWPWDNPRTVRRRLPALAVALLALLEGCAGLACTPTTVIVARKDQRSRLLSEPRGMRTDEQGRVEEVRREVIVTEYWVQDREGRWHRVAESAWRAVEPGQSIQVCR